MVQQHQIKAIETVYKGYRFRSRLEARWAVFFDALDITWEYEKEGYQLPPLAFDIQRSIWWPEYVTPELEAQERNAWEDRQRIIGTQWYLPDFWLPDHCCWLEIKGQESSGEEQEAALRLAHATYHKVYIFDSGIFLPERGQTPPHAWGYQPGAAYPMGAYLCWAECPVCGETSIGWVNPDHPHIFKCRACFIEQEIWIERGKSKGYVWQDDGWVVDNRHHPLYSPRLMRAYESACSARFEHGENGGRR